MHIALLSPAWPPEGNSNGIVTYAHWLRQGLRQQGCRVSVLAFAVAAGHDEPDVYPISPLSGIRRVASRLRRISSAFDAGHRVAAALKSVQAECPVDVIEMEESFGWARQVRDATRLPMVVKLHGPAFLHLAEEDLRTRAGQEKVRREGESLARSPVIVSPSRSHLNDTLARYRLRPAIAEHVVNPLGTRPETALWSPAGSASDVLLFVGRFDKIKGGDVVIRALRTLLESRPGLRLVFVGPDAGLLQADGSLVGVSRFIEGFDDPRLQAAVSVRGRLAPTEIDALRSQASCVLVPSRCESQGYTALEAMLQGCPVVCTNASGLDELVEHGVNGLKARVGDADDLAAQVSLLLDDRMLAARLGAEARRYVLRHHDPQAIAATMVSVYRRTVDLDRRSGHG